MQRTVRSYERWPAQLCTLLKQTWLRVCLQAGAVAFVITACAVPGAYKAPEVSALSSHWQGRMGIKVLTSPPRAFNARFELEGDAQTGSLKLFTPLGTTLASMRWSPGRAILMSTGEPQEFESLDALSRATLGLELPFSTLFGWLHGIPGEAGGWEADLSALADGKLTANRTTPELQAELKLLLESD